MLYPVKIEFKDYPSGNWQDWSEYLSEPPVVSKKVESGNEGETGIIVFDEAKVSFRNESGSPVYNAFSIDLTSKQRYLFRISAPKTDKTFVQLFEGIANFNTLQWNEFNNVISFILLDKLSALNILQDSLIRIKNTLNARVLAQYPNAVYLRSAFTPIGANVPKECSEIWMRAIASNGSVLEFNSPIIFPGELIRDPQTMNATSSPAYYLVTESWIETNPDGQKWNKIKIVPSLTAFHDGVTIDLSLGFCEYLEKEVYGIDVLNYNSGIPQSIDGLKFLEVFIKSSWPDITVTFRGISTFNIALNYSGMLVDEKPFGKDPLDVLKMLADSMKVYVFTDKTGNIIVQSKSSLATGGTIRSIGSTKIISGPEKKYFWDKLVDGVTVNVKSWVLDDVTGENLIGIAELTKQPTGFSALQKIKPKNSIKRELLVGDPAIDTQEELNTYAAQEALSVLNFYGLRHSSFDINLNLDDNTINWELIDNLTISTLTTFFTKMEIDLVTRNISLEAVEIVGHDYDFRQLVFGSAESSGSSIISSSSFGGGSYYSGITPIFNLPLQMTGGIVSLLTTDNLKLTSDQLDTIQPIKTTDTPTFNQMLLSAAATLSNHAVRADRTLQITTNAPLTGGGIAVDLTANRIWTLGINSANLLGTTNRITVTNGTGVVLGTSNVTLNLPQDIHTAATPTFNQLTLSSTGSGSSNAVRADRTLQITTTAPLTGGGVAVDLTANRSWTLGINSANLLGTTNRITVTNGTGVILGTSNVTLNLPQDIHSGASPTFAGLIINGNILQSTNSYIKNNFNSGWTGSGWQLDYGVTTGSKSYLEVDALTVRGSMRAYEFIINQIKATNGSLFVSSSAVVKSTEPGNIGQIKIHFETPNNLNISPFAPGDTIMVQRVDINGTTILRKIVLYVEVATGDYVDATYIYQFSGQTPQAGDVFVRLGNDGTTANRQGNIYLTSDDSASPYIDIYDGVTDYSNWATPAVRKVRLGKLTGLSDSNFGSLSGYGLYATNAYLKGGIWASFGNIAGWTIESQKISKIYSHPVTGEANEVALNASSNDISLHVWMDKDAVNVPSMLAIGAIKDYTNTLSANEYGIQYQRGSDTYFRLTNSVQQIAGWNFNNLYLWKLTSGTPTSSPAGGIVMNSNGAITVYGNYWQKRVALYYSAANNWGLIGTNESYQTVFQLGYTNQIAGWTFDTVKLTKGSATLGISLNTGSTPFITGTSSKGFEVYDYTNPKLFLGQKDGNSLDWNITKANTLTIKGEITTSRFSTNADFAGSYDYVVIDKDVNGHFLTVQKYIDASNVSKVRIQPNGTTDIMSMLHTVSGVTQTINFQYYNSQFNMFINGSPATRYRGNGTTLPTTDLRDGDMYYFTSTGKVYVYASGGWRVLN